MRNGELASNPYLVVVPRALLIARAEGRLGERDGFSVADDESVAAKILDGDRSVAFALSDRD
jgi:hypothetical protein